MNKHTKQLLNTCANLYSDCMEAFTEVEAGYGDRDVLARLFFEHHTAERALDAAYTHELQGEKV